MTPSNTGLRLSVAVQARTLHPGGPCHPAGLVQPKPRAQVLRASSPLPFPGAGTLVDKGTGSSRLAPAPGPVKPQCSEPGRPLHQWPLPSSIQDLCTPRLTRQPCAQSQGQH